MQLLNQVGQQCPSAEERKGDQIDRLLVALESRNEEDIFCHEALRVMRHFWPDVFRLSSPRPMKIGIDKDIVQSGKVPLKVVKVALRCYTRLEPYLQEVRTGQFRVDLEGRPAGRVRLSEAVNAEITLFNLYQKKQPCRVFVGLLRLATEEERLAASEENSSSSVSGTVHT